MCWAFTGVFTIFIIFPSDGEKLVQFIIYKCVLSCKNFDFREMYPKVDSFFVFVIILTSVKTTEFKISLKLI